MSVQTPEAKAKAFVKKFMLDNFQGIWFYSAPGGMFGKAGVPDHLYLYKGIFIAIEVKAENGRLSDSQKLQLKLLGEQGAVCAVVYGKDSAKMQMIKNAILKRLEK